MIYWRREISVYHNDTRYFGMIAYADDIVLLYPFVTALKIMLDICHDFAIRHDIEFSPANVTALGLVKMKNSIHQLHLTECSYCNHVKYVSLGTSSPLIKNSEKIKRKINVLYGQVNSFLSLLSNVRCDF